MHKIHAWVGVPRHGGKSGLIRARPIRVQRPPAGLGEELTVAGLGAEGTDARH